MGVSVYSHRERCLMFCMEAGKSQLLLLYVPLRKYTFPIVSLNIFV